MPTAACSGSWATTTSWPWRSEISTCPAASATAKRRVPTPIGLCLTEGRPVQVTGAEHFNVNHHPWTCSSAPFHDKRGALRGVITLSGNSTGRHQHTLALVTAAAETIEGHLRERALITEKERLNSMLTSIHNSISEGVVAVDERLEITHLNLVATKMLRIDPEMATGQCINDILRPDECFRLALVQKEYFQGREVNFTCQGERKTYICRMDPIRDGAGNNSGALITLSKKRDVINIAKRIGGNYARYEFKDIKGLDPVLNRQIEIAKMTAQTDSRALIVGESGTGKELFAQAVHNHSHAEPGAFCGHLVRGHPPGSDRKRTVRVPRRAPLPAPVGTAWSASSNWPTRAPCSWTKSTACPWTCRPNCCGLCSKTKSCAWATHHPIPVDVRVIAATNTDLMTEVKNSNFRKDLYYRLNTVEIFIPPLRERIGDLEILVEHIMERQSLKMGTRKPTFADDALEVLRNYQWPGNIRELENTIERAVLLSQGQVIHKDLLPDRLWEQPVEARPTSLKQSYRETVQFALDRCEGNVSQSGPRTQRGPQHPLPQDQGVRPVA